LETSTIKKLTEDSSIFVKFWTVAEPYASVIGQNYNMALIPGGKEGISAASVNGYNVGINCKLENLDERREAAIKVVEYITSKEMQKKLFLNRVILPAIPSLYDDEEACKINDCDLYKNIQPILDISYEFYDKYKYEEKYGKLASSYIFENKDLSDVLNKIEEIDKIYYVSMGSDDYYIGLIIVIIVFIFSSLMLFSLIFLFMEKFKLFFKNLSKDSWFLLIIGFVLILCSALTNIGMLSIKKCHLKITLNSIGVVLYLIIILYELIINFPEKNKISKWIKNHKYVFISFFLLMDFVFNGLSMINPYRVHDKIIKDSRNYQVCEMTSFLGKSMFFFMIFDKFVIFIIISLLIFIEWDIENSFLYEVRFIFLALYSSLLLIFISLIFNYVNIDYFSQFIIKEFIIVFMSISSYIFLYGYKLFLALIHKRNIKLRYVNKTEYYTRTENKYCVIKTSIISDNEISYSESDNSNHLSIEQLIESSPPKFYTKMYYHYIKESNNNFTRSC